MSDLIIQNERVILTCGAKSSGCITSLILDSQELLSFSTKSEGLQNRWRFTSRAYFTICNEAGADSQLPNEDSASRFISSEATDAVISTSTYTAYNTPLAYGDEILECSANRFDKRIRLNYLENPGIIEIQGVYDLYSAVAGETFSWSLEASLVEDLRNFFLFDAQPLGVGLPAGAPQVIGITTEDGVSIPRNTYGGMIAASDDQQLAIGIYTHGPSFEKNQLYHGATSAQLISPEISSMSVHEMNGPNLRVSTGRHKRTKYLCVGTYAEVLNQFVQLYNYLTSTPVAPPDGAAIRLSVVPRQIETGAGIEFSATVSAINTFGSLDVEYGGDVDVVLQGNGNLSGTLTRTLINGVTTFSDLQIDASGAFTLKYMSGTLTPATQAVLIDNSVPTINLINPDSALQSGGQFQLYVFGEDFVPGAVVRFQGIDRDTQYIGSDELRATILASDIFQAGTYSIRVFNPAPGGGLSNSWPFTVQASDEPLQFRSSWHHDFDQPIADIRPYDFGSGLQYLVSKDVDGWAILNPTVGASNSTLNADFENVEGAPSAIAAQADATTGAANKRAWVADGRVRKAVRLSDAARMNLEDVTFNVVGVDDREYITALELDQTNSLLYTMTVEGGLYCESITTPSAPVTAATALSLAPFLIPGENLLDMAIWTGAGEEAVFVLTRSARVIVVKIVGGALTYISSSEALSGATDTNPVTANSVNIIRPALGDKIRVGKDGDGKLVAYVMVQCAGYEIAPITRPLGKLLFLCDLDLANSHLQPKFKQTIASGPNIGKTYHVFYNPFPVLPGTDAGQWVPYVAAGGLASDGTPAIKKTDYSIGHIALKTVSSINYVYVAHGRRKQVCKLNVTNAFTSGITVGSTISVHPSFPSAPIDARDLAKIEIDPNNSDRFVVVEYRNEGARIIDLSVSPIVNSLLSEVRFDQTCVHYAAHVALPGKPWTIWSVEFRFSAYNFRVLDASTNTLSALYEKGWPMASDGAVALPPDRIYTLSFGGVCTWKPTGPGGAWELDQAAYQPSRVDDPEIPGHWLELNTEQIDIGISVTGVGDDRLFVASGAGGFTEYKLDPITKNPSAARFFTFPAFFGVGTANPDTDPRLPGWANLGSGTYYTNDCLYIVIDGTPYVITDITNRDRCEFAMLAWAYDVGTDGWTFLTAAIIPTSYAAHTIPLTFSCHVTEDLDDKFVFVTFNDGYFVVRLDELDSDGRMTVCSVNYTKPFATACGGIATAGGRLFLTVQGTTAEPAGSVIVYDYDTDTGVVDTSNPVQTLTRSSISLTPTNGWNLCWKARFNVLDSDDSSGGLYLATTTGTILEFIYSGAAAAPPDKFVHFDSQPSSTAIEAQFGLNLSIRLDSPEGAVDTSEGGSVTVSLTPDDPIYMGSLFGVLTAPVVAGVSSLTGLSIDLRGVYNFRASHNPIPGGNAAISTLSSPSTTIYNPRPILSSISPTILVPTSNNVTLTARGGRFIQTDSQISFNGVLKTTTMVDSTTLTAILSPPNCATSGSFPIFIHTEGAQLSDSALTLNMLISPAVVSPTLSPATDLAFAATPTLPIYENQIFSFTVKAVAPSGTINPNATGGVHFSVSPAPGWTGALAGTTVVPFTAGLATFFGQITDEGVYLFKAIHSPLSGPPLSPVSQSLDIYNQDPVLSRVSPNPVHAQPGTTGIAIFGSHFINGDSTATFDSMDRTTTFINNTQLIISLDPLDINAIGTHSIGVYNEYAQNPSNELTLTVDSPIVATATSATLSTVTASVPSIVANGVDSTDITVILRNNSNVRIPFRYLELSTDTQLNSFTPTVGWTDGSGEFVSTMRVIEPGAHTVVVNADNGAGNFVTLVQQPTVTGTEATGPFNFLPPQIQIFKGAAGTYGSAKSMTVRYLPTGDYEVYIAGETNNTTLLSDNSAIGYKTALPSNTGNAWIGRFNSDLQWLNGTYFGGSGAADAATGITLAEGLGTGGIFVSGTARTANFPHNVGSFTGPYDAWLANFTFDLIDNNWSTILGPYSAVSGSIAVDVNGAPPVIYAAGYTRFSQGPAQPAPTVFAVGTAASTNSSATLILTQPAGVLTGKVLIAVFANDSGPAVATATNWTTIASGTVGSVNLSAAWARFDVVGAGPYTFNFGATHHPHGVIIAVSGCRATGDIVGAGSIVSGTPLVTPSVNMPADSITTPSANNLVFWIGVDSIFNNTTSGYSGTQPTFTELRDGAITNGSLALHVAAGPRSTAGATGIRTATLQTAVQSRTQGMFSLLPLDPTITSAWPKDAGTIGFGLPVVGGYSAMTLAKVNASTGAFILRTAIEGTAVEDVAAIDTFEGGLLVDPVFPHDLTIFGTIASELQSPASGRPHYNSFKGSGLNFEDAHGDALLISLSSGLSTIRWSRYIGNDRGDSSSLNKGLAVAENLDILVCGRTGMGSGFDVTSSPYQASPDGTGDFGDKDMFITRLSSNGATVKNNTFLGGAGEEIPNQILEDLVGRVWVVGSTTSTTSQVGIRPPGTLPILQLEPNTPTTGRRAYMAGFNSTLEFLRGALCMPSVGLDILENITAIANPVIGEYVLCGNLAADINGNSTGIWIAKLFEDIPQYFYSPSSGPSDFSPPLPNPSTWSVVPFATSSTAISMTATTAIDLASPVMYSFEFTGAAAPGQVASGWQTSATYALSGLTPSTDYDGWVVRAKDAFDNEGDYSSPALSVTTLAAADVAAPTPNPLTWAVDPFPTSTTSISMTATTATDPSVPVQYSFEDITGGGHNSGWQTSATWNDTSLTPGSTHNYRVQARDNAVIRNVGSFSGVKQAITPTSSTLPTMAAIAFCPENNSTGAASMNWPHMISVRSTVDGHGLDYVVTVETAFDDLFTSNLESFDAAEGIVTATQAQDGPRKVGCHIWDRSPATTYYVRFKAVSSAGFSYSPTLIVTTPATGLAGPLLVLAYVKTQATQKSSTEIRPYFTVDNHTGRRFAWRYELATNSGITTVVETIEGFYDGPSATFTDSHGVVFFPRAEFWWSFTGMTPNTPYWLRLTCWNMYGTVTVTRPFTTDTATEWPTLTIGSVDLKRPPNRWGALRSDPRNPSSALLSRDVPMVMGVDVYNGNHNQNSTVGFGGGLTGEDAYTVYVDGTGFTRMWMRGQPGAFTPSTDSGSTATPTGTSNIAKAARALQGMGGIIRVAGALTDARVSDKGVYKPGQWGGIDDRTTVVNSSNNFVAYWDNGLTGGSQVFYPLSYVRVQAVDISDKPILLNTLNISDAQGGANGLYFYGVNFKLSNGNAESVFLSGGSDFAGGMIGFYKCFFNVDPLSQANSKYGVKWHIKGTGNWAYDIRNCTGTPALEHFAYVNACGALGKTGSYFIDNVTLDDAGSNFIGARCNGRTMFQTDSRGDQITAGNALGTQTGLAPGRGDIYFIRNIARSGTTGNLAGSLSIPGHRGRIIIEDHTYLGDPNPANQEGKFMNSIEDPDKGAWLNANGFAVDEVIVQSSNPGVIPSGKIQVNNTGANQFIIQGTEKFTMLHAPSITMNNRVIFAFTEAVQPGAPRTCGLATLAWAGTTNDALRTSSVWPANVVESNKVKHEFLNNVNGTPLFNNANPTNFNRLSKGFVFEAIV